jgi:hypothetical protein
LYVNGSRPGVIKDGEIDFVSKDFSDKGCAMGDGSYASRAVAHEGNRLDIRKLIFGKF